MKKVVAILIFMVMIMLVPGCSKDDSIALTLENYTDYLDISLTYDFGSAVDNYSTIDYNSIDTDLKITPTSSVILYRDVSVTIKIYGTIEQLKKYRYESYIFKDEYDFSAQEITVECNIGGNGSYSKSHPLDEAIKFNNPDYHAYGSDDYSGKCSLVYEVLSVTGTVSATRLTASN